MLPHSDQHVVCVYGSSRTVKNNFFIGVNHLFLVPMYRYLPTYLYLPTGTYLVPYLPYEVLN